MKIMDNGVVRDATPAELEELNSRNVLSVDGLAAQYSIAVQAHLDQTARNYGYDSIANAVTYAEEPAVLRFQEEGRALRAWRSLVWEACYQLLDQVKAGSVPVPSLDAVLAGLPALANLRPGQPEPAPNPAPPAAP